MHRTQGLNSALRRRCKFCYAGLVLPGAGHQDWDSGANTEIVKFMPKSEVSLNSQGLWLTYAVGVGLLTEYALLWCSCCLDLSKCSMSPGSVFFSRSKRDTFGNS